MDATTKAQADGDLQWALQLVDRLIYGGDDPVAARAIKAELLHARAVDQINCPTRHYYIQCAKEIEHEKGS